MLRVLRSEIDLFLGFNCFIFLDDNFVNWIIVILEWKFMNIWIS